MRASDADRDRVVDVLRAAMEDGRLTAEEFGQRVGAALSSRTFGELGALTADLVRGPGPPGLAVPQVEDVIRIDQRGGSARRTGRWVVPRRLELRPSWCDITLDFTDAVVVHDTLLIDMNMRGGSLALVVGPSVVVDTDSLAVRYTDVEISPGPESGAPVVLRIQLVGRMRYGWIGTRRAPAAPDELPPRPPHGEQGRPSPAAGRRRSAETACEYFTMRPLGKRSAIDRGQLEANRLRRKLSYRSWFWFEGLLRMRLSVVLLVRVVVTGCILVRQERGRSGFRGRSSAR